MKLYEVRNGYFGESIVKCFVIASSEERALELASESFYEESKSMGGGTKKHNIDGENHFYEKPFWTRLEAKCLSDDTSKEWRGESRDY